VIPKLRVDLPRVKVCCIASVHEAWSAIEAGASALGLVSAMPSGPGVIDESTIAEIAVRVPPPIATFLLTSETTDDAIVAQHRRCGTNTLQLCDDVDVTVVARLRCELKGIAIVQVIHVTGPESVERARVVAPHVHALLLDSGNTSLPVKLLGGTGRTHDWALSRQIRDAVDVPLFLAGGLDATNVASAIAAVDPFGIDVCSGVRLGGRLDRPRLDAMIDAIRRSGESARHAERTA